MNAKIEWGKAVNNARRFERIAAGWDRLLQDTLARLPVLSSGWDGSENERAARDPFARSYLAKRDEARRMAGVYRTVARTMTAAIEQAKKANSSLHEPSS